MTWSDRAACAGKDPAMWFAARDHSDAARAKAICAACPVRFECLEANLTEEAGIFGGLDGAERYPIAQQRRRARAAS